MFQKLSTSLVGKRTYLTAIVIAVLNLAVAANWINPAHLAEINVVLGALGLGALRAAVSNS